MQGRNCCCCDVRPGSAGHRGPGILLTPRAADGFKPSTVDESNPGTLRLGESGDVELTMQSSVRGLAGVRRWVARAL